MSFLTPALAIAGVIATAVPILIFLLWRQRRTPVQWGAMRFLMEAYRKHRRRLRIEQILLLAVRCLILVVLGAALARPLLEGTGVLDPGGGRVVYFVVDDGMAGRLEDADGAPVLQRHVATAREIITALDPGDRVGLITTARPARLVLSPPSTDHRAVLQLLDGLQAQAAPTDLGGAVDRLAGALGDIEDDLDQVFVYLLSEFRLGSASLDDALPASLKPFSERVTFLYTTPATDPAANVQVTAVDPARALILPDALDGSGQITVRLARQGGALARDVTRVRLEGDALGAVEPRVVNWAPGQSEASCQFILDLGAIGDAEAGVTARIDDDALDADNTRHTVLALRQQVRLVLIDRRSFGFEPSLERMTSGQWMQRTLAPTDLAPLEAITVEPAALDLADLRTADVVLLPRPDQLADDGWPLLRRFVETGGLLIVTPPEELNVHQWTDAFRTKLGVDWPIAREVRELTPPVGLALEQPASSLLRMISSELGELARPVLFERVLPVATTPSQGEVILELADGTPVMIAGIPAPRDAAGAARAGGLVVYLAAAPQLDWTNLPSKPFMVPLFQELVRQGLSLIRAAHPIEVGGRRSLLVGPAASTLIDPVDERIGLDDQNRPARPLSEAGLYAVVDGAGQPIGTLAVNVDPGAGRTDPQSPAAVGEWLAGAASWRPIDPAQATVDLERAEGVSPLAGWLLAALLTLLVIELLLARWFSHATRVGTGGVSRGLQGSMHDRDVAVGGAT
ncbi:MAG: VWA domain-containing protein [Phycisphaerales bacterium]|nr:BatA domain-containing protein [Phycisphaerae bacterium]NNF43718.1 VWA domain-containing protein [Phycisphaerales bacterium]NNM25301.1 VWA domain-containing protein [Phycisphaerales bacterium]